MKRLHFLSDNTLSLLFLGAAYFPALIAAIDGAQREVALETYIFDGDATGQRVSEALLRAHRRGVAVRVITDGIGSRANTCFDAWRDAGLPHRVYNPHLFGKFGFSRTHRKLAVIDRRTAFVGGINITDDERNGTAVLPAPRWDFAVQCDGSIAADVAHAFDVQWGRLTPGYLGRPPWRALWRRPKLTGEQSMAAFVARDNVKNRRAIEKAYLMAIGRARHEVWLANPYFVPGYKLRRALTKAARRGVAVRVLVGRNEFRLLDAAVPSLYGALLRAGAQIGEYDKTLLHGKVAVADDIWATVGSSNLDALSLFLNHEANIVILNDPLVHELRDHISRAFAEARQIDPARYAGRPLWRRFGNGLAYAVYRAAMRVLTTGEYR